MFLVLVKINTGTDSLKIHYINMSPKTLIAFLGVCAKSPRSFCTHVADYEDHCADQAGAPGCPRERQPWGCAVTHGGPARRKF